MPGRKLRSYVKVQRAVGTFIRGRRVFAQIRQRGIYLDLGCGPNPIEGFCTLDYEWRPGLDVCWDATRGLPFPNAHIGGIFTEHMLEHVPFDAARSILHECRRVLMPGKTIRIIVPDGAIYLNGYTHRKPLPYAAEDRDKFPFVTPMISVNRIFRDHGHCFIWDFETLSEALQQAGFENVRHSKFGESSDPLLSHDSPSREIESLYAEANRPN